MGQATVLITGVHGFIGKHLARRLVTGGYEVRGLGRRDEPVENVELVVGDVADRDVARKTLASVGAWRHA